MASNELPAALSAVLRGKCGFLEPFCEDKGQQKANQQTVLLHPDVAEDGRGSSLDVLKIQRDCLQTQYLLFWDRFFLKFRIQDCIDPFFRDLYSFAILSSTTGQNLEKHHFSTSLIRYDTASTKTAWNEEVSQRKKDGGFMSSLTYFSGSICAVLPHLAVSVLSRVMSFGMRNRCVWNVQITPLSFMPPPACVSVLWQRLWRRASRENTGGACKLLQVTDIKVPFSKRPIEKSQLIGCQSSEHKEEINQL